MHYSSAYFHVLLVFLALTETSCTSHSSSSSVQPASGSEQATSDKPPPPATASIALHTETSAIKSGASEVEIVKAIVQSQLLVPKSAEFAPYEQWAVRSIRLMTTPSKDYVMYKSPKKTEYESGIEKEYNGWVEAQNEFGTQVRNYFSVRLRTGNLREGYFEHLQNLPSSNLYGEPISVPEGKLHVRSTKLNDTVVLKPSDRIFYDKSTGQISQK